jgi:hypothetical protein
MRQTISSIHACGQRVMPGMTGSAGGLVVVEPETSASASGRGTIPVVVGKRVLLPNM